MSRYYYDTETGLYYLQSRYYDANTGRFLNADGAVSTGTGFVGLCMFSYADNDPINMYDSNGFRSIVNDGDPFGAWYYRTDSGKVFSGEGRSHKSTAKSKPKRTVSNSDKVKDIAKSAGGSIATGTADGFIEHAALKVPKIRQIQCTECSYSCPLSKIHAFGEVSGKIGGVLGGISFGIDIVEDCNTYVGWDIVRAIVADGVGYAAGLGA